MMKFLVITFCFGMFIFWMSVMVDAFPIVTNPKPDSDSTPVTLLLLGTGLSALAFLGRRSKIDE